MTPINSILIANRGEIASRIIRTCRKMGIRSIAVYSDADVDSFFVREADFAIHIGGSDPASSYLDQDKIIKAAKDSAADAIHPGYGFLSENASFARRCGDEGIVFIGPNPDAIEAMGSKSRAKEIMQSHQVPVVPGYSGEDQSVKTLSEAANEIGYPVLLKATAGGGGKGMRIVNDASEIKGAIEAAKRESLGAFGDDELIVEKYVASGRHIEFQIFGDQHGNAVHLLERECTIQRRYQKVIEESPSPVMDSGLRDRMGKAAVDAAKALQYDNAGTVEFIYDERSGDFYFLEVNTRLQVEHPVTEEITGLDLVELQIESAQGLTLNLKQEDIAGAGYAVECRLYAEDPENNFLPATGTVQRFELPEVEGLRVEAAIESGSTISIFYDPMIAKLIVWDRSRGGAHRKMRYVLENLVCLGTVTNQHFLKSLFEHPDFSAGKYDTHFIENEFATTAPAEDSGLQQALIAVTLQDWEARERSRRVLQGLPSGWRNNFSSPQHVEYQLGDERHKVTYRYLGSQRFSISIEEETMEVTLHGTDPEVDISIDSFRLHVPVSGEGTQRFALVGGRSFQLELMPRFPDHSGSSADSGYEAPMPSQIVKVLVKSGDEVEEGDGLVILSSMKMENTVTAYSKGKVVDVFVEDGQHVEAGSPLLEID